MVALLALAANAQMFSPESCSRSFGAVGGIAPDERDWNFATPGPYAVTYSPVFSQDCEHTVPNHRTVTWFGLDALPLYEHSYRMFNSRAPLWVLADWGVGRPIGDHQELGLQLVTNALAVGGGLRYQATFRPGATTEAGIDVRLNVLRGVEPDVQLLVMFQLHSRDTTKPDPSAEGDDAPTGDAFGGPDDDSDTWNDDGDAAPAPDDDARIPPPEEGVVDDWADDPAEAPAPKNGPHLGVGFEIGSVFGLDARFGGKQFSLGARVGENTSWKRDIALQPIGLASFEFPLLGDLHADVGAGATRHNLAWIPVMDVGLLTAGRVMQAHAGLLVGPGYRSPDIGFSWTF